MLRETLYLTWWVEQRPKQKSQERARPAQPHVLWKWFSRSLKIKRRKYKTWSPIKKKAAACLSNTHLRFHSPHSNIDGVDSHFLLCDTCAERRSGGRGPQATVTCSNLTGEEEQIQPLYPLAGLNTDSMDFWSYTGPYVTSHTVCHNDCPIYNQPNMPGIVGTVLCIPQKWGRGRVWNRSSEWRLLSVWIIPNKLCFWHQETLINITTGGFISDIKSRNTKFSPLRNI